MAQRKTKIITTSPRGQSSTAKRQSSYRKKDRVVHYEPLFTKNNYILILAGLLVMTIGYILMAGGKMPSPDVWEPDRIYSLRRVLIAPVIILIGLGLIIYSVFKK